MRSPKSCRSQRNVLANGRNLDGQAAEEFAHDGELGVSPCWPNQHFGERSRRHGETVTVADRIVERAACRCMVGIVGIEEADDDAGVEVGQRHSERRRSTSPAS